MRRAGFWGFGGGGGFEEPLGGGVAVFAEVVESAMTVNWALTVPS